MIDGVVNGAGRGASASSGGSPTTCSTRKCVDGAVNGVAESTGESGGLLRYLQSGRVQRYALLLFAAVGLLEPRPATSPTSDLAEGNRSAMDWFDDWALTLAVFVPLVGMAIVLLIPRAEETADQGRRAAHHAGHAGGRHRDPRRLRLRRPAAAVPGQRAVDRRHPQPLPPRHRRHLAAAADPLDARSRAAVHHLLVEPLPRAAQPEGVPRADPAARDRA